MNTDQALAISMFGHAGQIDVDGSLYIGHPLRVAFNVARHSKTQTGIDESLVVVALLHDIVEDTPTTLADLSEMGVNPRQFDALDALTRRGKRHEVPEPYEEYISRVLKNQDAIFVKRFDLIDNMRMERLGNLPPEVAEPMRERYLYAWSRVSAAAQAIGFQSIGLEQQ